MGLQGYLLLYDLPPSLGMGCECEAPACPPSPFGAFAVTALSSVGVGHACVVYDVCMMCV